MAERGRNDVPPERVAWGDLGRDAPLSREWGFDRGGAIDRHYIEAFLEAHAGDIRGRVLEVANGRYTRRFGRGVQRSDVLNVVAGAPETTIVADLAAGDGIPSAAFDCVICTQTLQLVYDVRSAIRTLHRILRPEGVLLATVPGISQISRFDMDRWGDYWRFSEASARALFQEHFDAGGVEVTPAGNALSTTAFLFGLSARELAPAELAHTDTSYGLVLCVRACRSDAASRDTASGFGNGSSA
jgi:SAM-dependent methyltransferase